MRLSVRHSETFTYKQPIHGTIQVLRMTPRDHTGHYVCDWEVAVDADCHMETRKDAFGNIVNSFSLHGPVETLTITASGEVETEVSHGVVKGAAEKVPLGVFLRQSEDEAQISLARQLVSTTGALEGTQLENLHKLMDTLHRALPAPEDKAEEKPAGQAKPTQKQMQGQHQGQQQEQDMGAAAPAPALARLKSSLAASTGPTPSRAALILCDAARILGMPARLISGHRCKEPRQTYTERQVWSEIMVDDLGWVAFDATDNTCPCEESIRVAVGLDAAGILPVRAGHYGGQADFDRETKIALVAMTA